MCQIQPWGRFYPAHERLAERERRSAERRRLKGYDALAADVKLTWTAALPDPATCPVCLTTIGASETVVLSACLHSMCRACATDELQQQGHLLCSVCGRSTPTVRGSPGPARPASNGRGFHAAQLGPSPSNPLPSQQRRLDESLAAARTVANEAINRAADARAESAEIRERARALGAQVNIVFDSVAQRLQSLRQSLISQQAALLERATDPVPDHAPPGENAADSTAVTQPNHLFATYAGATTEPRPPARRLRLKIDPALTAFITHIGAVLDYEAP